MSQDVGCFFIFLWKLSTAVKGTVSTGAMDLLNLMV